MAHRNKAKGQGKRAKTTTTTNMDIHDRLIITPPMYFAEPMSKCGYCKGEKPREDSFSLDSWSHEPGSQLVENSTVGFQCENMTVEMYDTLCNRGFRRSGHFLYKPDLLRSCCRLYTIRTTPGEVQPSKEYRSCVRRFCKRVGSVQTGKPGPFDYIKELTEASNAASSFTTRFEPPTYTEEKYALFAKYQEGIHSDFKHNKRSFERFLCDSPFSDEIKLGTPEEWDQLNTLASRESPVELLRVGPAHECYYYEGALIAIAVIDFLPSGLSSVYFIWDPAFKKWSLGKVSAMRELMILSKTERPYYYLGYYVEDCPKMNYKAAYGGELLDVTASQYYSLHELQKQGALEHGHLFAYENEDEHTMSLYPERSNDIVVEGTRFDSCDISEGKYMNNYAEERYGAQGLIADDQEQYMRVVEQLRKFGVDYDYEDYTQLYSRGEDPESEKEDGIRPIPNVVPGLLPLPQLLEMVENEDMNAVNGMLLIYDTQMLRIRPVFDFYTEPEQIKTAVCNIVRVLGMSLARRTLVII